MTDQATTSGAPGQPPELPAGASRADEDKRVDAEGTDSIEGLKQFAEFEHQYLRDYISLADQKAGIALTVYAAVLTFLVQSIPAGSFNDGALSVADAVALAAFGFLLTAVGFALAVVTPRLASHGTSLIFFADVADRSSRAAYAQEVASKTEQQLTNEVVEHCHALAGICAAKYGHLRRSLSCGAAGFVLFLVALYLLSVPVPTASS